MAVVEFVAAAEVDPVYLDAAYYALPDGAVEKLYTLFDEAVQRAGTCAPRRWRESTRLSAIPGANWR
jgi:non-homologous end joining protein Ku